MGFWGNILQGKPAFENPDAPAPQKAAPVSGSTAPAADRFMDTQGKKLTPQVAITNVKSRIQGSSVTTTAWIKNLSTLEIELDKITVLGARREIDRRLRPQESHEVTIYNGPVAKNDHDTKATLQYKIVDNGDYFSAEYRVEFHYESDGSCTIEEFHTDFVRDI